MKNKRLVRVAISGIMAIAVLITAILMNVRKTQKVMSMSMAELARAMNYEKVEEGDDAISQTDNVKFSAYFLRDLDLDGEVEKLKGTCKAIGTEDTLYIDLSVLNAGNLKNAKIEIDARNFYFQTSLPKDEQLKENYIGNNVKVIEFNELNSGNQKQLTGVVRSGDYSYANTRYSALENNINNYSRTDNKIVLTGTYVAEDGTETEIRKEIELAMDWYGIATTEISNENQTYTDLSSRIDEENKIVKFNFTVNTTETSNMLYLSKNTIEGTIPLLKGHAPIEVKIINAISENTRFEYNSETRKFSINKTAITNEDGKILTEVPRNNNYTIEVTYTLEAYQSLGEDKVTIKIPVNTYYEGYNNPNTEFTNPYKSNEAKTTIVTNYSNLQESVANFAITVGKKVYSPESRYIVSKDKTLTIYSGINEEEIDNTYIVRWYAYTGKDGETSGIVMKETKNGESRVADELIKTNATPESMEDITSNIGIYFTGADKVLKEDGWIKVYDEETDNLLVTFTKDDWGKYTSSEPYQYELPVKHIRIETSENNKEAGLYVYNIKELDDEYITTNYTKEEFDNFKYIKSTLNGYLGGNHIKTATHEANYESPYSIATISISNNNISTQSTEKNAIIEITTERNIGNNQLGWGTGSFLVKLPKEILAVKINNVQVNNSNITISSYEIIENNEGKFIKICTKNSESISQTYTITLDVDITPDPRIATTEGTIELYGAHDEKGEYYYSGQDIYDVNGNLNTTELVNQTTTSITLVSPNSILTNQIASEYDSKNNIKISPEIADITPLHKNEKQTAKVGIQLKNNYESTVSEVLIVGKIPFEGNKEVVSGKDLESEFTTKMTNTGIEIPEELQGKVTVYYSEKEMPTKEISNKDNGWTTAENVTEWDNVKTFLIDFEDKKIEQGKEYIFYYKIEMQEEVEFNKVAYSHYGVYFCVDTDEGKYRTQTESNKLGFRIAEKFNLEIIKTQKEKDKKVAGATYSIKEILADGTRVGTKTAVTDGNGNILINNLYAERTYEIQEIKSPNDYELNTDIIRIFAHIAEDGTLTVDKLQGTIKEDIILTKNEGETYKVTVQVEDEAKARLKITKKEQGSETVITDSKYRLTGYGLPTNGIVLATNENGEINVSGLRVNEVYTLEETKSNGYYLAQTIKLKIINSNGIYSVETLEGTVAQSYITEEDSLPVVNLTLENEKKAQYILEINRVKRILQTKISTEEIIENTTENQEIEYLQGAKFKLYKGTKEIGSYTTDKNGKITIENLYQYIEGKQEDAIYTLKEVVAPEGYTKVKDITFKVQESNGTLTLINISGRNEKYTVDGRVVKLTIESSQSFKLINKDAETGEILANVKFAIYNIDDKVVPATNGKGEIIGTKELINGKEYYTLTTDENGIIMADLPEGYYKAVEVQAPDKYDIENATYYFGIGGSREGEKRLQAELAKTIGGGLNDYINSISRTSDGGYIVGGYFYSKTIDLGNGIKLTNQSSSTTYSDGMIIKYNKDMKVEWAKAIGGSTNDGITSVTETSDGSYIVGGYFYSTSINLGNNITVKNHNTRGTYEDGLIVKYSKEGIAQWTKAIGGTNTDRIYSVKETVDGDYIVAGYFHNKSVKLENNITLKGYDGYDGMLIKYSKDGQIKWAKAIVGTATNDYIKVVSETNDGGYIAAGYFSSSSIDVGNGITVSNNGNAEGLIVKYSKEGVAQWAKAIGGSAADYINAVSKTSDGGCIVGGYFESTTINLGNGIQLNQIGTKDGMIIKYSSNGEIQWAKTTGGSSEDYINSVIETSDGGYIASGYSYSSNIDLGNGVVVANNSNKHTNIEKESYSDVIMIKYSSTGETQWAKAIGGGTNDYINSLEETSDEGYAIIGYFQSSKINLGNGITLNQIGATDGMIIKYVPKELPKVIITEALEIEQSNSNYINTVCNTKDGGYIAVRNSGIEKYNSKGILEWSKTIDATINSILQTSDGSYIAVGDFEKNIINLGNGIVLNSNGSIDGMVIKYSSTGETQWAKAIGGSANDYINSVTETTDGEYIVEGDFYSDILNFENVIEAINNNIPRKMAITIREQIAVPEMQELIVETSRKAFEITTDVTEIEGIKGGSISGEDEIPYEVVKYGESNTKEIVIKPEENYDVIKVTVNGEDYTFDVKEDHTYTIQLTNITEDKHIEVTFGFKGNKVIINKVDATTQEKLSGAVFRLEKIEESDIEEGQVNAAATTSIEIKTNSMGQAILQIPFGKYTLTELVAPEGYELSEKSTIIEVREDGNNEFTIENNKLPKVIVHHYLKGTTTKVAEDDILQDKTGNLYTTKPKLDLQKYALEKAEDGNYIIPENMTGKFELGVQEVIYYYIEKQIPLFINHYIEGTEESVVLSNGERASRKLTYGNSGDTYRATAVPDSELSKEYELVEEPSNSSGIFEGERIEVTYYYKKVVRSLTINTYKEDGVTPLEGAKFTITTKDNVNERELKEYITDNTGKIKLNLEAGEYIVTEIQAPVGYQLPNNPVEEIVISKTFGDIAINITNNKEHGKVIVQHYIENSTVPVLLEDGTQVQDIIKTGPIGEIYATKPVQNLDSRFELIEEPSNASGIITKDEITVTYYYRKPAIEEKMTVEKKAIDQITTTETKVYYEIKFTATINYFDGNAKIILVDTLPYAINEAESELAGGTYNPETKTITWEEEIKNIEVLINELTIERTKILNLKYKYDEIFDTTGKMENKVNAKIELLEQNKENPDEYVLVKEDIQEVIAETLIRIPAEVIVHHYIYDEEKDEYTTIKLAEDETIKGVIGEEYKTATSTSVPGNYSCINISPERHEGKMTKEKIEVTYYYQLMQATIESTINKTAVANKQGANKVAILTKEDGVITYNIKYNINIKDYIGKAKVEIVDTLPYNVDEEKSDFAGGIYDKEAKTITWTETLEEIDTYAKGTYETVITKQIKVVYKNQDLTQNIVNTVEGKVKTYYPENHISKPGKEIISSIARDSVEVAQEYKVALKVEKQWEDNNNVKGKRPESVTIEIKGMPNGKLLETQLNAENNWNYEIADLPKYDAQGNKIVYEVTEKETVEKDLEYYENPVIVSAEDQTEETTNYVFIVKNAYRLLNTDLKAEVSKTGTEEIVSAKQEVEYTIKFKAEIIEYIGAGKVKIVDTLPYKIDAKKSNLANGVYDDITQTITWEEELPHINTEISGENYKTEIIKQIKVVYKDIELTSAEMTNKVNGKIELYESEVKDEKEATYNTKINVAGKVIVNYIDIDTGEHIDRNYTYEISEKIGSTYKAEKKEIANYEYIQSSKNETGIITEKTQEVIYYYSRIKTSVLVKYQDTEGNKLAEDVLINGQILDEYMAKEKEIENYRVAQMPENKEGIMTQEQIVVIYVYEKIPTKVIVKYIYKDIETGKETEISPAEVIEGLAGDEYITERKVITNYRAAEPEPTNKTGEMLQNTIEVIYYYEKIPSGTITVKYIDINTEEEITYKNENYKQEIKGFVGDKYKTEEKEIPYYVFVKNTDNVEGILTEKEDTVIYYYRKQNLDFSIEKIIKQISLNGINVRVPDKKLTKIELKPSKIEETEIIITYEIIIKNEGEIKGKARISEIIPQGYEILDKDSRWQENDGMLEAEIELEPGKTEKLTIKQRWLNTTENLGYKSNNVEIGKIENVPDFEDTSKENNKSSAGIIINVNTGGKNNNMQIIVPIILAVALYVVFAIIITIKKEEINKR